MKFMLDINHIVLKKKL